MEKFREPYFVLSLPLKTEAWQGDILEKRFEINRQIYNALLERALKRYRQMVQTRAYREIQKKLEAEQETVQRKKLYQSRDALVKRYRLCRYDICQDTTKYRRYFSEHTDSPIVQNLADEVWQAIDGLVRGSAGQVYPRKPGQMRSLSGKTNRSSVKFQKDCLVWKGLVIPVDKKRYSFYEKEAFQRELRYCRVKRAVIRGKNRYFIQLVFKGKAPVRKCPEENRDVSTGLDVGFQRLSVVAGDQAIVYPLPKKDVSLERRKRQLICYLERSRRSVNPEHYFPDGRVKPGRRKWTYSRNYIRAHAEYREICRKQLALQKQEQYRLIQKILSLGGSFYIEDLHFAKLGRAGANGSLLMQTAPAGFVRMLEYKAYLLEKPFYRVSPFAVKAAGFNHYTGTYQKMPKRKSWRIVAGRKVDKDLYSAFLLSNTAPDLQSFDLERCRQRYPAFLEAQEGCLEYLAS